MSLIDELKPASPTISLMYSNLMEQFAGPVRISDDTRFYPKKVGGKTYWIRRTQIGQTAYEISLGRESEELLTVIEKEETLIRNNKKAVQSKEKLVSMLLSGGFNSLDPLTERVLKLMEESGLFIAGGVLVGSHAFRLYGPILSYQLPMETTQTADIDLSIHIGIKSNVTDLNETMKSSGLGFLEIPSLDSRKPSTSYKFHDSEVTVDLLTPPIGSSLSDPVYIKAVNSYAEPMRFLDYLIKDPIEAVVVAGSGILVNIPQPARFAIHKLAVSQRRTKRHQIKVEKDLNQAASLIEILARNRPGDLDEPISDLLAQSSRKIESEIFDAFNILKSTKKVDYHTINVIDEKLEYYRTRTNSTNDLG